MKYTIQLDGKAWCATDSDFINLQESIAGFGDDPVSALQDLIQRQSQAIEKLKPMLFGGWHLCAICSQVVKNGEQCDSDHDAFRKSLVGTTERDRAFGIGRKKEKEISHLSSTKADES